MNESQQSLDRFEQRLLTELRRVVAERPAPIEASGFRYKRTLVLAGGLAAAAGVAIAAGLPIGGDSGGTKAYAVSKNPDGTVTVKIDALSDAAGLERELSQAGVPALVQYVPPGKTCAAGAGVPAMPATRSTPSEAGVVTAEAGGGAGVGPVTQSAGVPPAGDPPTGASFSGASFSSARQNGDGSVQFTMDGAQHPGQTLVIRTQEFAGDQAPAGVPAGAAQVPSSIGISFVKGTARPCKLIDAG
jgi:hypothetical protein